MSIARKDDRHNEDLAKEIVDSFNRAVGSRGASQTDGDTPSDTPGDAASDTSSEDQPSTSPRFVVTGDKRYGQRGRGNAG